MNQFRTSFNIDPIEDKIDHNQLILSLGSCFAEHMASKLKYYLFDSISNPNGVIYNPFSLAKTIEHGIAPLGYQRQDLVQNQEYWYSWYHHHLIYNKSSTDLLKHLNEVNDSFGDHLSRCNYLMVTFGSAYAYRIKENGIIVANCHKLPSHLFEKIRLDKSEIVDQWLSIISTLKEHFPNLKIILTVSPVRHIRDGIIENQRSKSILLLAVEKLVESFSHVKYFPSYEIMMDDLRDYRFYASDMLHPSEEAIDYIWEKFNEAYIAVESQKIIREVHKLQQATAHRTHNPDSAASKNFQRNTQEKWQILFNKYPFLVGR